jgi:DUF2934 family protein
MAVKAKTKAKVKTTTKSKCSTRTRKAACKVCGEAIQEKAYSIWEQKGRPDGQDFDIWLQAEKELLS